uniref:Uncharacterized protein n=1 Tax=Physcomitrium patens TaxID=3218 RepID=A0A2K1J019_PHYPA|nr:hypothetical protein PHYPA_022757 [Physcomitrium patens]
MRTAVTRRTTATHLTQGLNQHGGLLGSWQVCSHCCSITLQIDSLQLVWTGQSTPFAGTGSINCFDLQSVISQ